MTCPALQIALAPCRRLRHAAVGATAALSAALCIRAMLPHHALGHHDVTLRHSWHGLRSLLTTGSTSSARLSSGACCTRIVARLAAAIAAVAADATTSILKMRSLEVREQACCVVRHLFGTISASDKGARPIGSRLSAGFFLPKKGLAKVLASGEGAVTFELKAGAAQPAQHHAHLAPAHAQVS